METDVNLNFINLNIVRGSIINKLAVKYLRILQQCNAMLFIVLPTVTLRLSAVPSLRYIPLY